ncbi:hypothetical protein Marme_0642 [Marinomonas mediterranea MMB-1]|jgi:hypothetical protein|uniref:Uncharacterized protein n=1 Tax=Marinomonas mediterranea (strain ATCC 700492 / JCM 21426 / NBRC 103028 / MMB-1) TaxID=717774 RepID=F2K180_MARM1|nr:hypothetical protein Marme_0642 [Marinomonas mediterranea MMB-1]
MFRPEIGLHLGDLFQDETVYGNLILSKGESFFGRISYRLMCISVITKGLCRSNYRATLPYTAYQPVFYWLCFMPILATFQLSVPWYSYYSLAIYCARRQR